MANKKTMEFQAWQVDPVLNLPINSTQTSHVSYEKRDFS